MYSRPHFIAMLAMMGIAPETIRGGADANFFRLGRHALKYPFRSTNNICVHTVTRSCLVPWLHAQMLCTRTFVGIDAFYARNSMPYT